MKFSARVIILSVLCMSTSVLPVASVLSVAIAQQTIPSPDENGELGRIFYDAAQRQALERAVVSDNGSETKNGESPTASDIRFNGVMRIRGGHTNAWVNGHVLDPADQGRGSNNTGGLNVELRGESLVVRHESGQRVLQPGDSLNQAAGAARAKGSGQ